MSNKNNFDYNALKAKALSQFRSGKSLFGKDGGYFTQSLPAFQRKVYHPKGGVEADINLVIFFGA